MINFIMESSSSYLLEVMTVVLVLALVFRYMAYRANKSDQIFFSTFTREIEKRVEKDDIEQTKITDIVEYIEDLLDDVSKNLPERGLRFRKKNKSIDPQNVVSVKQYTSGNRSLINNLKTETNAFKASQKPNFSELTDRVMNKDTHWVKLYNIFPVESVIRMIDVLPGIFIVIGIFGTFVGISLALPQIAEIDFNNIAGSSSVLSNFVNEVSFAMKTSITGIAFSLIISLMNTLYPISSIRDTIANELEDCLEYLWYFVHGGRDEHQQVEAYSRMVQLLENIESKLETSSENIIQMDVNAYKSVLQANKAIIAASEPETATSKKRSTRKATSKKTSTRKKARTAKADNNENLENKNRSISTDTSKSDNTEATTDVTNSTDNNENNKKAS